MEAIVKNIPYPMDFKKLMMLHGFNGMIPPKFIVDKRIPGIGATKCELLSKRNSVIIAPYTAIIEVKKEQYGDSIFALYGEYDFDKAVNDIINEHLANDNIKYKKIMTTPESFFKVKQALQMHSPNYINDYFMLIDECDVFVADAIFRKKMLEIMPDFFSFTQSAMISATPLIPSDQRFIDAEFKLLKLEPDYSLEYKLNLIITNNINSSARDLVEFYSTTTNQPSFIFTNCKRTIAYLCELNEVKDDYRIFCSERLIDFFALQSLFEVSTSLDGKYARFNFLTSRFFSGVDIFLDDGVKPNIIMVSNLKDTPHSIINPDVGAIQIFGRCRKGISSITHLATKSGRDWEEEHKIIDEIDKRVYHLTELAKLNDKGLSKKHIKLLKDIMQKNEGFDLLNKDGSANPYFKDNELNSALVLNRYSSRKTLENAYSKNGFFKVKSSEVYKPFEKHDILKLKVKTSIFKKSVEVFQQLHELVGRYGKFNISNETNDYHKHLAELQKTDALIYDAYFEFGPEKLVKFKFKRKEIQQALNMAKSEEKKNNLIMIDEILTSFSLGRKIYISVIEKILNRIYKKYAIVDKRGNIRNAKGTDIEEYFEGKRVNGKKKDKNGKYEETYYILKSSKYRLSDEYYT